MQIDIISSLPAMSGWGVVGFAVGFVAKKIMKYLIILAGVYFATLIYLQYEGWITINQGIEGSVDNIATLLYEQAGTVWTVVALSLPLFGAFGAGAFLGFRKG